MTAKEETLLFIRRNFHGLSQENACGLSVQETESEAWKCAGINKWHHPASASLLTFSDDLLNGDLVPTDGEAPADEICARMTGPGAAAAASSRTRPRAHQLPARIKELPHDVEAAAAAAEECWRREIQTNSLFPVH